MLQCMNRLLQAAKAYGLVLTLRDLEQMAFYNPLRALGLGPHDVRMNGAGCCFQFDGSVFVRPPSSLHVAPTI